MSSFFKIIAVDKKTCARVGICKTSHGEIRTPVFVPVGTQGTVKSISNDELSTLGVQIFLANTYHLYLRPGIEVIEKLGGLHKFTGWDKPLMTDSGGFQVFSLARTGDGSCRYPSAGPVGLHPHPTSSGRSVDPAGARWGSPAPVTRRDVVTRRLKEEETPKLVKVDDDGVTFCSHLDGSPHRFTPEKSIEIQQKLGADIILAFDQCPPYEATREEVRKAVERTHQWALRSLKVAQGKLKQGYGYKQALFGIVQGGVYQDLREESTRFIGSLPFDGLAIGGVAVGEEKKEMYQVLDWVVLHLPKGKPRHLLGVGEIDDIFEAVERGVDMFDCVMPTRLGRMGHVLVKLKIKNENFKITDKNSKFTLDITKAVFKDDPRPIMEDCVCDTCQNYSRAYLHHLFRARELLAYRLATYHNLYFMINLMKGIQEAILRGEFRRLKKEWLG